MKRIISILIENKSGALARVVGLFHQRGYNIESLNVGAVFDGSYSRMTVTTRASENDVEQITKQMNKIIDDEKYNELISLANTIQIDSKLADLFEEIKINLGLKMRVVDLINCKHVVNQVFGHYIPVDEFL